MVLEVWSGGGGVAAFQLDPAKLYLSCCSTHTHKSVLWPSRLFPGLPEWASIRTQNQSGFYCSKRQWVALASAGPYVNLYFALDR